MSEPTTLPIGAGADDERAPPAPGRSAGRLLRDAREAQGLALDGLAASMKVHVRKLELLEADRFDELPDATFTRALAQAVCRALKIDAAPVLALLPAARGHRIEQVSEGLNAPFRDRSARLDPVSWGPFVRAAWAPALLLALAALVWAVPDGFFGGFADRAGEWWQQARSALPQRSAGPAPRPEVAEAPEAASAPATEAMPAPAVETVFSAPPTATGPVASSGASAAGVSDAAGPLQLRADAESWIEVKDAGERVLLSRSLQPGETVTLDGALPMRVKIGNAAVTEVRFRGAVVDIAPMTAENIARLVLK
ncbi:helix-turn-helix domain-containing protein [Piscinibacter sakaiensis]|uniref:Putative membrane protein n=1 Tax=Piscinibacter sakaiensis TaxID=1547922 RepID=A0A0K8P727_PISS1|nr:helix-turn-helix domain-containing protein [Piscinibacter sakaiensis]GAP38421.1 putative membrane protein [Piscinibacter sakaiensis]